MSGQESDEISQGMEEMDVKMAPVDRKPSSLARPSFGDDRKRSANPEVERPAFRFVQMQTEAQSQSHLIQTSFLKPPPVASAASIINKEDFFDQADDDQEPPGNSLWCPRRLRPPPAFYPLEKSTRLVEGTPFDVANRLAQCLRTLSVQAIYDNEAATASLLTAENVEMHLCLWQTPSHIKQQGVLVELQRRKGDSIAFHRYSRSILDAAVAEGDAGVEPLDDIVYSKKVQRLLGLVPNKSQSQIIQESQEHENAIIAIEIAHGLLMKDRMDATQLGLESLCLLTDPRKTGYITALLTAHVVLLGSTQGVCIAGVTPDGEGPSTDILMNEGPFQEIRETILNLVQFSRIGEITDDLDEEVETAVVSIDKEHMTLLHNLALAVLANALDVIENSDRYDEEPEETKPRARLRTSSSNDVAEEFMTQSKERSEKDIISTLISELGKAHNKPHNATLSAKCIGSLCRASEEARRRAKELGAKQVVMTALDVGVRTHLRLETECKKMATALAEPTHTVEEEVEEDLDDIDDLM